MIIFSPWQQVNYSFYKRNAIFHNIYIKPSYKSEDFYIGYAHQSEKFCWIVSIGIMVNNNFHVQHKAYIEHLSITFNQGQTFNNRVDAKNYIDNCLLNTNHKICNTDKEYSKYKILV